MHNVKSRAAQLLLALLLCVLPARQADASFTSLYVFGDGVSTTTAPGSDLYHEGRFCNGLVWVEVLAQWQGIPYEVAKNFSYFGHDSVELGRNVDDLVSVPEGPAALVVIWCANADMVFFLGDAPPPYDNGDIPAWDVFIAQSMAQHVQAVTELYNKGARILVMPNAVNIAATPSYALGNFDYNFIRDRTLAFNASFEASMASLEASLPDLVIYRPDAFAFFEQVLADPGSFGLINPIPSTAEGEPKSIAALDDDLELGDDLLWGPGANYIFWDFLHPTAKFQMHLAELAQKAISPVKVTGLSMTGGNVQLQVANIPLGREGFVQGCATMQGPWLPDAIINEPEIGGATTKAISFPASGPRRFYRVGFPVVWTWP
jgi:phospholipase/lecithinase/hemolysin